MITVGSSPTFVTDATEHEEQAKLSALNDWDALGRPTDYLEGFARDFTDTNEAAVRRES